MATLSTPQLLVFRCACSAPPGLPRKISFVFSKPYMSQLYLRTLAITETNAFSGVSGNVAPGTATHAGACALDMGTGMFSLLYDLVSTSPPALEVQLIYDDVAPFPVSDVLCGVTQPLMATESTLQALQTTTQAIHQSLGNGNISASLETLNHTAQALLHAIVRATRQAPPPQRFLDSEPPTTDSEPPGQCIDGPEAS